MSNTLTRGVRIIAEPCFIAEQSSPQLGLFVFGYRITVRNEGDIPVQLRARHWIITNGEGVVEEVRGAGVVGHQPTIAPGGQFEYTSGCPLGTPVGTMHGSFQMVTPAGDTFAANIAPFRLMVPNVLH